MEEIGVKIIYNVDYPKKINWAEVEKLITFSAVNFAKIKTNQERDTVRHYSWYVSLLTLDTFTINKIINKQNELKKDEIAQRKENSSSNYWIWIIISTIVLGLIIYNRRQHSR